MGVRHQGRVLSFEALYSWEVSHPHVEELLEFRWADQKQKNSEEIRAFAELLTAGTLEHVTEIDAMIRQYSEHWDLHRIAKVDLTILRLSLYALMHQKEIPPKVIVNEAVELAREYGSDKSYRFVNGLLDGMRKGQEWD